MRMDSVFLFDLDCTLVDSVYHQMQDLNERLEESPRRCR